MSRATIFVRTGLVVTTLCWLTACGGRGEAMPAPTAAISAMPASPTLASVPPTVAPTPTLAATSISPDTPAAQSTSTLTATAPELDFAPLVTVIEQEMAQQQVPGLAIAVISHGAILFRQGFGTAEVGTDRPVTPATEFRIGSITKPLTAIGLLQLVDAGLVDLDAPVVRYLPEFTASEAMTVRQLLAHSSGLGDAAIPDGRTDATALHDYVASLTPESIFAPPDTVFSYSNTGYNVLGRIIEVVSGMSYVDYMNTRVFPALHMPHTTFDRAQALAAGLALGYYPGRDAPQVVDRDPDNGAEYPSGFAFSTVEDLTQLARFLLDDGKVAGEPVLSPQLFAAMQQPEIAVKPLAVEYGLGLLRQTIGDTTLIGHNGTINGYAATLQTSPSHALAVIVLSNRNNYDPARILQVAFALFGTAYVASPAAEIPLAADRLAEYAGRYVLPNALSNQHEEAMTVAVQDGQLTASLPGVTFAMRATGVDRFDLYAPNEATPVSQLAFLRDETGAIQFMSFTLHALVRVAN